MGNLISDTIRIGTLVQGPTAAETIPQILPHGFESFAPTFWQTLGGVDVKHLAEKVNAAMEGSGAVIGALGIFGNPLGDEELDRETLSGWKILIENAHLFGTSVVAGFTGRVRGKSIPDSIPAFTKVFSPLAALAEDHGVRIAFENCAMEGNWKTGDWNIAHNPDAWELMFDAVSSDNIGLEWEPCHQMTALIDPLPQLRKWMGKIFHVHGKDASIRHDIIRDHGIQGNQIFAYHRTPGFGDSNWVEIISSLRQGGFKGSIDIEGWHDPVYREELEMSGQVYGLNYLKQCRGSYVPNPK